MCGILGSINIGNTKAYLSTLIHRGPDDSGVRSFEIGNNTIDLLHRRLSIVDLSEAGKQPMLSYSNRSCIIFNGEIYNHAILKEDLGEINFNGHSDTETIVNYIDKFGINDSLQDFNGIFALAYLDLEEEKLFLARDRFGVKPLYYYFENNKLLFSSELRPLNAILSSAIDQDILMNSLRMRYTPSPFTIYKNIFKVEPGQLLTFNFGQELFLTKKYFVSIPKSLGTRKSEHQKLVKEYGDLFEKAVERQLMADVEVGILLSGGVDSALVAAIAKQKSSTAIKTFTVGFKGDHRAINEIDYARQTAEILGLEHFSKEIDFTDFLTSLREIVKVVEEPIGTTSIIPMYFLSQLAASKVKVVLSGQGADEPLGGYNKYRALPWIETSRLFKPLMPLAKCAQFVYNSNENFRRLMTSMQCVDDIDSLIEFNAISSMKEISSLVSSSKRSHCLNSLLYQQTSFKQIWKERMPEKSSINDLFLYYDLRTSLADDLLMYTDKITMHHSLECRVPILDNNLIDFIESLHKQHKFNSKTGKIIHKDFAREYLPSSIVERPKLSFKSPTEAWFKKNKKVIAEVFSENVRSKDIFDLNAMKHLLDYHSNGQNKEKQIFLLLSISYLLDSME